MSATQKRIGVLTSGGDAQGMNAALRSVVRAAIDKNLEVFAIYEGYAGMVAGGKFIRQMDWGSVGGIIQKGGTIIGTARSDEFRTRDGRKRAATNLIMNGIDSLVVIGGDGSLTGANLFRQEWSGLIAELAAEGIISPEQAQAHPHLGIVGLVGSIDNDMTGTDMTIGADTALHRITVAVDQITSTADSHQRTFVIKVMGRNCGYLALMGAIAAGADWVMIPENPPNMDNWEQAMCDRLREGRQSGKRDSIVIIAEGAQDKHGNPVGSSYVQQVLEEKLGEDVRVTVLGHVQRGGAPSAFDRNLGTLMGYAAVDTLISTNPEDEPQLIAFRGNRITSVPLMEAVEKTRSVAKAIADHNYERAMDLRSSSFREAFRIMKTFSRALPHPPVPGAPRCRLAVMNAGAPSPGMNTATRAVVRLGLDKGHIMYGINNGFEGLIDGDIHEMNWNSVNGWASMGGSELGTNRHKAIGGELYSMARAIENHNIQGLIIVGGISGYQNSYKMLTERQNYPAFNIPIVIIPASINNHLPGSELSIGADTALNNIVEAVDKIKQSAVATRRVFIVEVMGRYSGYLALMSGLATGTEKVYINEEGITLKELEQDVEALVDGFQHGRKLGLIIRNEYANPIYTTPFIASLFEAEGGDLFDVRTSILGHLQQGGDPSPFDRIMATRLANRAVEYLTEKVIANSTDSAFVGLVGSKIDFHPLEDFLRHFDEVHMRPKQQWWMDLRPIACLLSQSSPQHKKEPCD